jgi:hypothetical protein
MLHARTLMVDEVSVEVPIPADMEALLASLRRPSA